MGEHEQRRSGRWPISALDMVVEQGRKAEEAERNGRPPELQRDTMTTRPSE